MTFDNKNNNKGNNINTVQSTSTAAASFIETLGRKVTNTSTVSPRIDDNEKTFLTPSAAEGNCNNTRTQRANSIVTGASPFVTSSSLWAASASYESLNDSSLMESNKLITSTSGSLWETPRRSSVTGISNSNWKCVGSAASMLHDSTGRLKDLLNEVENSEENSSPAARLLENSSSFDLIAGKISESCASDGEHPPFQETDSRSSSPLQIARENCVQLPTLLHKEIEIENAEEAAEIFKRSSMDSLLDFDPSTLFASLNVRNRTVVNSTDLSGSALMSAASPTTSTASDFRRHSFNWLASGSSTYEAFEPSNFFVKSIAEVSLPSSGINTPTNLSHQGSPTLSSFDSFPEEFIFAPSSSSSVAQFSKKRFARRHSIAADGVVQALEDNFAQSLNFGNPADTAEFIPSGHNSHNHHHFNPNSSYYNSNLLVNEEYTPITGNVFAAYAGLLGADFVPSENFTGGNSTSVGNGNGNGNNSEMNTFLSSMRSGSSGCNSSSSVSTMVFNHQIPVSYTPAQAGINPTVLSFPNATFHLPSHKGPLYLIEFKSGRTELFFVVDLDTALKVKIGDLVIVEADRGEDFGRVTGEMSIVKVRQLISQLPHDYSHNSHNHSNGHSDDAYGSNGNVNHNLAGLKDHEIVSLLTSKEIVPKRIHRHATSLDMKFLQAKAQEEAYAMNRCQSRIKQKKLPMEVVDAEYQW